MTPAFLLIAGLATFLTGSVTVAALPVVERTERPAHESRISSAGVAPNVLAARPRAPTDHPGLGVAAAVRPRRPVAPGWHWPLSPKPAVVRGFSIGPHPWSPGHRGVDLAAGSSQAVLAPAAGVISFAGFVAGRAVVTVLHSDNVRTTYQPVVSAVPVGTVVRGGEVIGHLMAAGSHCSPRTCLHWGALRADTYIDPLSLLPGWQPRIVLLPLGGSR